MTSSSQLTSYTNTQAYSAQDTPWFLMCDDPNLWCKSTAESENPRMCDRCSL